MLTAIRATLRRWCAWLPRLSANTPGVASPGIALTRGKLVSDSE
jgi:hypothetical protein